MIQLEHVFPPGDLKLIDNWLPTVSWLDGKETAQGAAKLVKKCQVADRVNGSTASILNLVARRLQELEAFQAYAMPREISMQLCRYREGDEYGAHVDLAIMGQNRTDVAFTIGLTRPYDGGFDGGMLVIETPFGPSHWRSDVGSMVAYPATMLHCVEPVTSGERIVIVGWVQSIVRDAAKRELIADISMAKAKLFEVCGKCAEFDALSLAQNNLVRMWME